MSGPQHALPDVTVQWMAMDDWLGHHHADAVRWLTPGEYARMQVFRVESARAEFVAARWLLRTVLSNQYGAPPQHWTFTALPGGKPMVCAPLRERVHISVSHAAGVVACATSSNRQIGLDVERSGARFIDPTLADRYFAPAEARALREVAHDHRADAFCRLWTLKEAYLKGIGVGLAKALDTFAIIQAQDGPIVFDDAPDADQPVWQLWHERLPPDLHLAVAAAGSRPLGAVGVRRITPGRDAMEARQPASCGPIAGSIHAR